MNDADWQIYDILNGMLGSGIGSCRASVDKQEGDVSVAGSHHEDIALESESTVGNQYFQSDCDDKDAASPPHAKYPKLEDSMRYGYRTPRRSTVPHAQWLLADGAGFIFW